MCPHCGEEHATAACPVYCHRCEETGLCYSCVNLELPTGCRDCGGTGRCAVCHPRMLGKGSKGDDLLTEEKMDRAFSPEIAAADGETTFNLGSYR